MAPTHSLPYKREMGKERAMSDTVSQIVTNGGDSLIPLQMRDDIAIRAAEASDLPFIDALQQKHSRNVGWLATVILEKRIAEKKRGHSRFLTDKRGGRGSGSFFGK